MIKVNGIYRILSIGLMLNFQKNRTMSKAEEKSLKAYPQKIEWVGNQWDGAPFDVNSESRVAYKQGYHQAEKDLALTWEDIDWIVGEAVCRVSEDSNAEQICKEVLKRYKETKKID
jgi:hypothetical protein